jgi:uncharacterized iron-regulated membrane protein
MRKNLRLSMAWLHTWAGLVVGWLLFATFLTGTTSYFREEISLWMRPELPVARTTDAEAATRAIHWLQRKSPDAVTWLIDLPDERTPVMRVFWRAAKAGFSSELIGPATGELLTARATRGGDFFYFFHFDLGMPYPIGRWLVALCASIMLVAIVSGIVTHRRFFKDFFTFRSGLGQRSWLDAHNATAVLALPFHIVITYSGLMTLMFMYFPFGVRAAYGTDRAAFDAAVFQTLPVAQAVGRPATLTEIAPLLAEAGRQWQGGRAGRITVNNPGDAGAEIQMRRRDGDRVNRLGQTVTFDGVTGALRGVSPEGRAAASTYGTLYGLHIARFAGMPLRFALFVSGLMGSTMVGSGLVMWTVKRRAKHAKTARLPFGLRLVERLNVGALAGLPIAMALFFWANRLLPVDMATRSLWEQRWFLIAWVAGFLHPLLRPAARAWKEQLWLGALLWSGLPALNALTTRAHLGVTLRNGDWGRAGVDIGALLMGIVLASLAIKLGRRAGDAAPAASRVAAASASAPAMASASAER